MSERHKIEWIDGGTEPKGRPDPRYPNGIDLVAPSAGGPQCRVELPYPARRCGRYLVVCQLCDYRLALTTGGRIDDPRSVTMPCKSIVH